MEHYTGPDARVSSTRSVPNIPMRSLPPRPALREKARSTTSSKCPSGSVVMDDEMKIKNENALLRMKVEFHDKIHREYPVKEFVKHVWNFDDKEHPDLRFKINSFIPRPAAVDMYNNAPNEASCYPHLATITDALLTHLFPDPIVRAVQKSIIFVQDNSVAGTGEYASFRPDLTWSTSPKSMDCPWDWLLLFAEVKRAEKASSAKKVLQGNVAHAESTLKSLKRKNPSSKDDDVEPPPKRRKQVAVSQHEAQTAKYLNEMLSHGIRSFASGFFINGRVMQLWYGDRMGLVKSCAFNWQANPDLMALVFAAAGKANLAQLGISPLLEFLPTSPKFDSYEDGRVVLPAGDVVIGDNQKRPSQDMVFEIDMTRSVWTDWGAVGRGTTVVPLKAIGVAEEWLGKDALVAKMAWPHAHRTSEEKFIRIVRSKLQEKAPDYLRHIVDVKCFMARNMTAMHLPRAFMGIELAEADRRDFRLIIMKKYEHLNWVDSADEFRTVFEHVVRAHHWVWATSGVLHHDISISNIMFYREADRRVVGVLCDWDMAEEKLSDEEYQASDARFLSAHPVPMEDPAATTAPQGQTLSTIDEQDDTPQTLNGAGDTIPERPPRPRYRTGTGLFIAIDILLEDKPPLHRYRHELESFFFLLSYVCAVFNPEKHQFGPFSAWEQGDLNEIARSKWFFYASNKSFKSSFDHSHEEFRLLVNEWVTLLWRLFSRAASKRFEIESLLSSRDEYASKGRDGMVAKADLEIGLLVTAWRKMVTYEAFMDCLELPLHLPSDPPCPSCSVPVSWCSYQA